MASIVIKYFPHIVSYEKNTFDHKDPIRIFKIDYSKNTSVKKIKEIISTKVGISINKLCLMCVRYVSFKEDESLKDDLSLGDLKFNPHDHFINVIHNK